MRSKQRDSLPWKPVENRRNPERPRVLSAYATNLPSCLDIRQFGRHATMENTTFDWLDSEYSVNYRTQEVPTSSGPRASPASSATPAAERADQPSGGHALPLLRLSGWESEKQYDK